MILFFHSRQFQFTTPGPYGIDWAWFHFSTCWASCRIASAGDNWISYRKVMSSRLPCLVAHLRNFRLFMKGKFDAYELWPLAKRVQNWIVDRTEVRFASFLPSGFITATVVNPLKRKLAKRTSVDRSTARDFTVCKVKFEFNPSTNYQNIIKYRINQF